MKITEFNCNILIIATLNDPIYDLFMTGFPYDKDKGSEIYIAIISFSAILIVSRLAS
jgi:hypothetical protein